MTIIAMILGGAIANALTFTGSSFLFSSLSKDSIDKKERKKTIWFGHRKITESTNRMATETAT